MTNIKLSKADKNGIATLTFDLKDSKVNILKTSILNEFDKQLNAIAKDTKIKLLIIQSAKEKNFIAGADINEIKDITKKEDALKKVKKGQDILDKLAALPCTTLAYIRGSCMGGGTELILACDFRVAASETNTSIGLPEVNLGIIPGFGGTQRLPRLVGLINSLPIILTGKTVDHKKAFKIGLVDGFFPVGYEKEKLAEFAQNLLNKSFQNKLIKKRNKRPLVEKISYGRQIIFNKASQNLRKKTNNQYPAPVAALKVINQTHNIKLSKGLKIELEEFSKLVTTPICKNLISLYFASEDLRKDPGSKAKAKKVRHAGVVGAGVMGGGIAWFYTKLNIPVRMKDINWDSISLGYKQINNIYGQLLKIRKVTNHDISKKLSLVTATTENAGFKNCDIISEAVVEDIKIKKKVLQEFEHHISKNCILASNTSSLSISEMAKALQHPERFVGMHFFNPVNRMPLVEIIPGEKTNAETIATVVAISKKAGKTPVVVSNCAGFLVNRILLTYINEAFYILDETGEVKHIDKLVENFGMPMGPFILADTVGLDVGYKVAKILEDAYGKRMEVSPLIEELYVNQKLLGKKANLGIYKYAGKSKEVNQNIASFCNKNNKKISDAEILNRLFLIMVNEAARCLDEKVVKSASQLDMALIMGTGFPAFRGGLLKYADEIGIKEVIKRLENLSKTHGQKFKPCPYLKKIKSFY